MAGVVLALLVLALGASCGSDGDEASTVAADGGTTADAPPDADDAASGTIRVRLERVEGFFIEGFEVGLRFETTAGELITQTLWTDFVETTGRTDADAYYDSVLEQPVPAGPVTVRAEVNIGMGPGPSIPDLDGELPCALTVDVPPDEAVVVEVGFDGPEDCLRQVDPPTTEPTGSVPTTSTVPPATTQPTAPALEVGSSHYVDVDLECQAFELGGTWSLVEGDTSTWQPPGERHEGGTFTITEPGRGRFVGDAAGEKTAVFERLPDGAQPPCEPVPRLP